jgi:5-methyltetrahydrofolate--homocysteine methyltransferase
VSEPSAASLEDRRPGGQAHRCGSTKSAASANRLLVALDHRPLLLDSAMGTRLIALGLDLHVDDPAVWNLTHPEHVLEQHRRDVSSGSGAVLTNTFGANRCWLAKFGRAGAVESINRRAVELARLAAGPGRFVLGDLGPTAAGLAGAAVEQAAILVDAGVDALCFETFKAADLESVLLELAAGPRAPIPLLVSLWEWPEPPDSTARRLIELGASVIGMNCQAGIEAAVAFAERMDRIVACPLLVKPGAGDPGRPDGSPGSFAAAVPRLLEHNVRLLGGCCGTTDRHVAALRAACETMKDEG